MRRTHGSRRRSRIRLSRKNKLIIFTALAIFLSVALAVGAYFGAMALINGYMVDKRDEVIAPLEFERARLRRELASLENDLVAGLPNGSTITTVVTDLSVKLYDILFPIYEGVNHDQDPGTLKMVGSMCLHESELPGGNGNISVEQFNEMMDAGWNTVLRVTKKNAEDLTSYVASMTEKLGALGIAMPDTLYFDLNAYAMKLDEEILSLGMTTVLHHREHALPIFGTDAAPELWRVGCISWNSGETVATFGRLVSSSGTLVITYSFERAVEEDYFPPDIYGAYYSFNKMLSMFRTNIEGGKLAVSDVASGRDRYAEYKKAYSEMSVIMEARRIMLEEQIAKLDEQIFDIYSKFGELN